MRRLRQDLIDKRRRGRFPLSPKAHGSGMSNAPKQSDSMSIAKFVLVPRAICNYGDVIIAIFFFLSISSPKYAQFAFIQCWLFEAGPTLESMTVVTILLGHARLGIRKAGWCTDHA